MLNKKKKILDTGLTRTNDNQSFFKLPSLSKNLFLQHNFNSKKTKFLPFVFQKMDHNNVSFTFSDKTYRTNYYFSSYIKNNNYSKKPYKKNILFLNKVFKQKKKSKFLSLKTVRGGLMITSLGLISFVPKSLASKQRNNDQFQTIVNFKLIKKKHNFSFKQDLKINLVSSLKKKNLIS